MRCRCVVHKEGSRERQRLSRETSVSRYALSATDERGKKETHTYMTALTHDFDHRRCIRTTDAIQGKLNASFADDLLDFIPPALVVRFRIAKHMIRS